MQGLSIPEKLHQWLLVHREEDLCGAQGYQSMAQMLLNGYVQGKTNIKRAMRPKAASLASGAGGNTNVRVRSYAPRMWVYR